MRIFDPERALLAREARRERKEEFARLLQTLPVREVLLVPQRMSLEERVRRSMERTRLEIQHNQQVMLANLFNK